MQQVSITLLPADAATYAERAAQIITDGQSPSTLIWAFPSGYKVISECRDLIALRDLCTQVALAAQAELDAAAAWASAQVRSLDQVQADEAMDQVQADEAMD